ncbi:MAG TPA: phosphatidylserine decarboxylase [Thermoplasmata archaeon]|nr:phosphatidylserine decarboxylase [Thermoplasmata archaeon]
MFAPGADRWIGPPALAAAAVALVLALRLLPAAIPELAALATLAAIAAFFAVFFRDPERAPGAGIVSPADGHVRAVERDGDRLRISVFMNVTDVHVNRAPLDGRVDGIEAAGEGFRAAFRPDADRNVRRHYRLSTDLGPVEIVQITGLVARRIVPYVSKGAALRKGDRFGMIVLGSRVDLLLPSDRVRPVVAVGDRVRAGATTVAERAP